MVQPVGPNRALRALLAEATWTEDHLARRVNALAAESGTVLRLDRRSVTHWLAGRRPRPPIPALVAEAFTRELGRPVTIALAGLGTRAPAAWAPGDDGGNAVRMLRQLGFDDSRRQMPAAGAYSVAALAVPRRLRRRPGRAGTPAPDRRHAPSGGGGGGFGGRLTTEVLSSWRSCRTSGPVPHRVN